MNAEFVIPLNGWARGRSGFRFVPGKEFFRKFGNEEILDAALQVNATVDKSAAYIWVDLEIEGSVTVACDRCLEDLVLPVSASASLSVKFGGDPSGEDGDGALDGGREILCLGAGESLLELDQVVYDYVCVSLPMVRIHPEGGCNPETTRFLSPEGSDEEVSPQENPFAALKGLFKDK